MHSYDGRCAQLRRSGGTVGFSRTATDEPRWRRFRGLRWRRSRARLHQRPSAPLPGTSAARNGPVAVSCSSRDGLSKSAAGSGDRGDIRAPPARTTTRASGCRRPSALHESCHRAWLTPPARRYRISTGSTPIGASFSMSWS